MKQHALPAGVFGACDYEAHARQALDANAWAYFSSHAGDGCTARANAAAWQAIELLPRVLRSAAGLDTSGELFGRSLPWPLLVAPMALQRMAHPDGELATALAASAQGAGMVLSSQASLPLEAVAAAVRADADRGPLWLQLYFLPDRGATLDLVRRAEAAGFEALVVTVDATVRAARPAEQRAGFRLPPGIATVNLPPAAAATSLRAMVAQAPGWHDIAWLRAQTALPLLLKGVLHPADVRDAVAQDVDGLIVSNHGGRTLDTAVASARALPAIVDAARGSVPVLVDGGLRRGTDVFKALALGASAVLVGQPVLWGLASAGAAGAAHVLRLLRDEFEVAMAQCGAGSLADIGSDLLAR
ncbi:MAG: alpha-hydroxy acid oxidase [Ramlibacter sp.]